MTLPAAKQGDQVIATDIHIVMVPSAGGPVPTPLPHPFTGILDGNLSTDVNIMGMPAATINSTASNTPPHIPTPPGTAFQIPPQNSGTVIIGSATVNINGKPAARTNDTVQTCADPVPNMAGKIIAAGTIFIGG